MEGAVKHESRSSSIVEREILLIEKSAIIAIETEPGEELGSGSFGIVYLAEWKDGTNIRRVALKVCKEQTETMGKEEAKIIYNLNHENVIKVSTMKLLRQIRN